jgi:hypothetical protein
VELPRPVGVGPLWRLVVGASWKATPDVISSSAAIFGVDVVDAVVS